MKQIVVLMHECYRGRSHGYLIDALAEVWRKQGLGVSCIYGIKERPHADLLLAHIDLTRTHPEYAEFIRAFPNTANREALDISKRRISAHLLQRGDDYRGPVIVKTDANSGGLPEAWLFRYRHPVLARVRSAARRIMRPALGERWAARRVLQEYPVYKSMAEVPAGVFKNRALVVERFLPEQEGDRYFMRHYLFLGDRARSVRVAGLTPFLKRAACEPVDEGLPVPDEVIAVRRRLGLDYGKIDYVIHQGQVVILDANGTPTGPGTPEATARTVGDLADGVWSLLARPQSTQGIGTIHNA